MKIVINCCYGGFGLSKEAADRLTLEGYEGPHINMPRNTPALIKVVEDLGAKASASFANLRVVDVQGDWWVNEYDGYEEVNYVRPSGRGINISE